MNKQKTKKAANNKKSGVVSRDTAVPAPENGDNAPARPEKQGRFTLIAVAAAAFALAFFLAWLLFGGGKAPAVPEGEPVRQARTLGETELGPFLAAADAGDFQQMSTLGKELFEKGDIVPDHERLFSVHAVDGFPPYRVYAFLTSNRDNNIYRVILTIDETDDKIESFMAEATPIVE